MTQAEEYIARAELAERQAQQARDATERDSFLEIARLWRRLARERFGAPGDGE